jgi:hypothetical protein
VIPAGLTLRGELRAGGVGVALGVALALAEGTEGAEVYQLYQLYQED